MSQQRKIADTAHAQHQQIGYRPEKLCKPLLECPAVVYPCIDESGGKEKEVIREKGKEFLFHKAHTVGNERFLLIGVFRERFCEQETRCDKEKFHADISSCEYLKRIFDGIVKVVDDNDDGKEKFQQVYFSVSGRLVHSKRSFLIEIECGKQGYGWVCALKSAYLYHDAVKLCGKA